MRNVLLVLFLLFVVASCSKNIEYRSDFHSSYNALQEFKRQSNNSYSYVTGFASWTGYSTNTTITVNKGVVIRRSYESSRTDQNMPPKKIIIDSWTEEKAQLGTHNAGFPPITLDEIYNICKSDYLTADSKTNDIFFETKNSGMISTCGYVPHGCADDCFRGIYISSITTTK